MNKYLRAISYNFLFFIAAIVFFLVITPIAIKIMGEEFFGLWSILIALMLFSNVGTVGIAAIVMKFSSEAAPDGDAKSQANNVMTAGAIIVFTMALLLTFILLSTRDLIVENIQTTVSLRCQFRQAILIIGIGIFPQFLCRVPHGFLLAGLHNRQARQLELLSSILLWLGAVILAWIKKDLVLVAIWCVISNALVLLLYIKAIYHIVPLQFEFDLLTTKKMLHFSGYMFLENLGIALFQHMDKIVVGATLGPALAGVYSVGTSLALRLSMFTGQITEVMIPYASLKASIGDRGRLYTVFRQLSRYMSLLLATISSGLIIWMREIISLWISPDYATRYSNAFRVLIVAYGWLSLCRPAHQTLTGLGKVKFTALIYLLSTTLMLTGLYYFSRQFGLIGAASSNLLMTTLLVFNLYVYHTLQDPIQWRNVFVDLQWGLLLPIFIYCIHLFLPPPNRLHQIVETLFLGLLFAWIISKDEILKAKILQSKHLLGH